MTGIQCNTSAMAGCRSNYGILTDGVGTSGRCYFGLLPATSDFYQLGMTFYPIGQPRWTPVLQLGAFVGISVIGRGEVRRELDPSREARRMPSPLPPLSAPMSSKRPKRFTPLYPSHGMTMAAVSVAAALHPSRTSHTPALGRVRLDAV